MNRPIREVINVQNAKKVRLGSQKYRLSPVAFSSLVIPNAQRYPSNTVKKNGGK